LIPPPINPIGPPQLRRNFSGFIFPHLQLFPSRNSKISFLEGVSKKEKTGLTLKFDDDIFMFEGIGRKEKHDDAKVTFKAFEFNYRFHFVLWSKQNY